MSQRHQLWAKIHHCADSVWTSFPHHSTLVRRWPTIVSLSGSRYSGECGGGVALPLWLAQSFASGTTFQAELPDKHSGAPPIVITALFLALHSATICLSHSILTSGKRTYILSVSNRVPKKVSWVAGPSSLCNEILTSSLSLMFKNELRVNL